MLQFALTTNHLHYLFPGESFDVDEKSHQLGNGQRRVGVVQLDGNLVRERVERGANGLARAEFRRLEAADNVLETKYTYKIVKINKKKNNLGERQT